MLKILRAAEQPLVPSTKSPLASRRLLTREVFDGAVSVTWIELKGAHARQNSGTGNRFYYILSGTAVFTVENGAPETADAGDIVCLPKSVDYVFAGDVTYLYVNVPATS